MNQKQHYFLSWRELLVVGATAALGGMSSSALSMGGAGLCALVVPNRCRVTTVIPAAVHTAAGERTPPG